MLAQQPVAQRQQRPADKPGQQNSAQQAGSKRKDVYSKTRMCKFHLAGRCTRGQACSFAHSATDMQPLPDFFRTRLCPDFLKQGTCSKEDSCSYAHSPAQLRAPAPAASNNVRSDHPKKAQHPLDERVGQQPMPAPPSLRPGPTAAQLESFGLHMGEAEVMSTDKLLNTLQAIIQSREQHRVAAVPPAPPASSMVFPPPLGGRAPPLGGTFGPPVPMPGFGAGLVPPVDMSGSDGPLRDAAPLATGAGLLDFGGRGLTQPSDLEIVVKNTFLNFDTPDFRGAFAQQVRTAPELPPLYLDEQSPEDEEVQRSPLVAPELRPIGSAFGEALNDAYNTPTVAPPMVAEDLDLADVSLPASWGVPAAAAAAAQQAARPGEQLIVKNTFLEFGVDEPLPPQHRFHAHTLGELPPLFAPGGLQ